MNATAATQAKPEPRPWLAHYPAAVPPEIGDPGTLADLIGRACET
jgi:long-chain acyl-CoA synthetase